MAISNRDQLINAMANNSSRVVIDKASLASQVAGQYFSMWRSAGLPAQGAIPTTAALCTNATTGAIGFAQQTAPATSYLSTLAIVCSNNAMSIELHDRLAHMGGLNLTLLTAQTVGLELDTLAPSSDRIGDPSYGDVQPWLEIYTAGGATASNATINVTFDNNSSGNLNTLAVSGTLGASRVFSLNALKTTGQQGLNIKRINTVTLSASTGTAGNFGFTFTRPRAYCPVPLANFAQNFDWASLGLSEVPNGACLTIMGITSTTSTGTIRGGGKISHG